LLWEERRQQQLDRHGRRACDRVKRPPGLDLFDRSSDTCGP
jgi:hypothetical protein